MNMMKMIMERECKDDERIVAMEVWFDKPLVDALWEINKKNRPIVQKNTEFFERKIQDGAWARGAFTVTVNSSMTWMIDSQHHILALKNCGYPKVRGVIKIVPDSIDQETFMAMDCGSPRGLATMLGVMEVQNYAQVSSILKDYLSIGKGKKEKITPDEALDEIEKVKDSLDLIGITREISGQNKKVPTYFSSIMLKVMEHNHDLKERVCEFIKEILSGDFSSGNSLYGPRIVREMIIAKVKETSNWKRIIILKAFDSYVEGSSLSPMWRRIEPSNGHYLGVKYCGVKIDVSNEKKHCAKNKKQTK